MKIVHVEDFFHPDAGYQCNVLLKYLVNFGHEVTIITAELDIIPDRLISFFGREGIEQRDREFEANYGVRIIRFPAWKYFSGRVIFQRGLLETICSCHPDIVYVHGNDTFTGLWTTLHQKKLDCPLIMDSHMVDMASENKFRSLFYLFYRTFITPIIKKHNIQVIRTADDEFVQTRLGIPISQAPVISFGSDTLLFHPDKECRNAWRKEKHISDDAFIILYAGKMDVAKGGKLLADMTCLPIDTNREIIYMIIGNTTGEYGKEVESRFSESPYRVLRFPTQKYTDLASLFKVADLALIPRQCSLSLYDFCACGLPVLAENNPINIGRCSHNNGWTFAAENLGDFKKKLEHILALDDADWQKASKDATAFIMESYDYKVKAREYEDAIRKAYDDFYKNCTK